MTFAEKLEKAGRAIDEAFIAHLAAEARTPHNSDNGYVIQSPDRVVAHVKIDDDVTVSIEMPVRKQYT